MCLPYTSGFVYKPYTYDARRMFGQRGVDWQEGINFERLRRERLERARALMKKYNLGALVCFNNENIRYITSTWQGQWKANIFVRYCVLPESGDPVLFETAGADMECALLDAPWLKGNIKPAVTWVWSGPAVSAQAKRMAEGIKRVLEENGIAKEKIGVDMMDWTSYTALKDAGLDITNAWPVMSEARVIKTKDELELCKQAAAIAECAFDKIRNEWLKPGVRECEIAAKYAEFLLENGFEFVPALIVASGTNTNPYRRWATDKIIREGDLVIVDIAAPGPGGYFEDITRTFICGDSKPTPEDKEAYRECYETLNAAIKAFRPGATTREIAENLPPYDDDKFGTCSLFQFAHSIGLSLYEGLWISRGYSLQFPEEIKSNMYFAVETYSGNPKRRQAVRLEQDLVVTETGYELFSTYPFEEKLLNS